MKKRILFILLSVFAITSFANEYNFSAKEIFVGYYISDAYANVIEYDVCHDNNSTDISNDIQTLINTVKNADIYPLQRLNVPNMNHKINNVILVLVLNLNLLHIFYGQEICGRFIICKNSSLLSLFLDRSRD